MARTNALSSSDPSSLSITSATSDPLLAPFLRSTFDPTAYLNSVLPPLAIASIQQPIIPARHSSLADLAGTASSQLTTLSAQQARLVDELTQMSDAILRSGSRLAYEVEVLRGEAGALADVLADEKVREDLERFEIEEKHEKQTHSVNGAKDSIEAKKTGPDEGTAAATREEEAVSNPATAYMPTHSNTGDDPQAPIALSRLRTLHQVRLNLSRVISTFDSALSFPLPPSLVTASSTSSSFVSVAAPSDPALEAAGQEAVAKIRASVVDCFDSSKPDGRADASGIKRAEKRLEELGELMEVWKGTVEEKARMKLLADWERELTEAKTRLGVRDRKDPGDDGTDGRRTEEGKGANARTARSMSRSASSEAGGRERSERRGLFGGLRRLRDEIYLE